MTDETPRESATVDGSHAVAEGSGTAAGLDAVDEQLIDRQARRARAGGLQLAGEGGLLKALTKRLMESALDIRVDRRTTPRRIRRLPRWRDRRSQRLTHRAPMQPIPLCELTDRQRLNLPRPA